MLISLMKMVSWYWHLRLRRKSIGELFGAGMQNVQTAVFWDVTFRGWTSDGRRLERL